MPVESFYVTTPIYYVNGKPHIGHAYTTVLADVLARYHRLRGTPTFFLTGTDEHGQKVYDAAKVAGISPQEQTDRTVVRFVDAWKRMEIAYDDFIRTTEPRHTGVVVEILADLHARGEIYADDYEGWYSVSDERFYTEKELVDGKSPDGKPVERLAEKNYFFRMGKYQDWLVDYIEKNPEFIQPASRRNETLGFLRKPLSDLCISRPKSRMPWGIELPFDTDYVCYVWFDALVNYISAIGYRRDDEQFRTWWPVSCHLLGKDIITTHTVYWPTMLKALGLPMPRSFFAHGWWLTDGEKMSKSVGNVTDPMDMMDRYGIDALRYYLLAEMTLGQDASFTEDNFILRYNADLANDLGNLTSRVLKMIARDFDGVIPPRGEPGPDEAALTEAARSAVTGMDARIDTMGLDRGLAMVIDAVRAGNRYFDKRAPWKLAKAGERDALGTVLYHVAELLRIVSGLLFPVMPGKMTTLRRMLGVPGAAAPTLEKLLEFGLLEPGTPIGTLETLFPRIDRTAPRTEATLRDRGAAPSGGARGAKGRSSGGAAGVNAGDGERPDRGDPEGVTLIDIDTFARTELRVARVLTAEPVEGADRLLRLTIDLGAETRQLVAGIAEHYRPDEISGKLVVVVANLKPARIRGVDSQGMLLAAKTAGRLRVVTVDGDVPVGSGVS